LNSFESANGGVGLRDLLGMLFPSSAQALVQGIAADAKAKRVWRVEAFPQLLKQFRSKQNFTNAKVEVARVIKEILLSGKSLVEQAMLTKETRRRRPPWGACLFRAAAWKRATRRQRGGCARQLTKGTQWPRRPCETCCVPLEANMTHISRFG
jgi:hypothetical protein